MFVVLTLEKFEFVPIEERPPISVAIDPGNRIGYLPVYNSREDALRDYPESKLIEVSRKVEKGQ